MKKQALPLLILILLLGFLQTSMITAKKCNDLIILFDQGYETPNGLMVAVATQFIRNLHEKSAPMVVPANIIKNFCIWKTQYNHMFEEIKQEASKTKSGPAVLTKTKDIFSQQNFLNKNLASFWILISATNFSNNDWHCYAHKQADFFLFVPKKYIASRASQPSFSIDAQLETCGIKTTDLININNISPESILNYLQSKPTSSFNIIDGIKSIFITKKPSDETEDMPAWNFYICGHGGPAKTKETLKEESKELVETFDALSKRLKEIEPLRLTDEKMSQQYKMLDTFREPAQDRINFLSTILQSAENLPENAIVTQSGTITGTSFSNFARLMAFFNSDIKTNFIHYVTCFGGGYNQTFVNEELRKLDVNFIVSSEGTNETSVNEATPSPSITSNGQLTTSSTKFTNYFNLLENFFGDQTNITDPNISKTWKKDPLAAIIGAVVQLRSIETNQPFVRVPAAGVFTALQVDKKVKILTHSIVKAHESENRTIDITSPEITTVLIYPTYIQVPLKTTKDKKIVSPTPQSITQLYKTTHIFEEIITDQSLRNTIFNFILPNSSYSQLTFIIKKLICTEKSPVENVIIQIIGKFSEPQIVSSTNAFYTLDNITKHMFIPPVNLGVDAAAEFIKIFNKTSFTDLTPQEVTSKAFQLLDEDDKKDLTGQPITLSDVVAQFEKRVNKEFGVQKPGALKKVLLLKQLHGLEEAAKPDSLLAQLEWLQKSGKDIQNFISSLNRQKIELDKLNNDFKQMMITKNIDQKEYADIQNKIKAIDASLSSMVGKVQSAQTTKQPVKSQPTTSPAPIISQPPTLPAPMTSQPPALPTPVMSQPTTPTPIMQPSKPAATLPVKLSQKEEDELRRAVIDYKKGKSRANAEQIINKYAVQYPNDPVVKAKINEKNRFDASAGIAPIKPTVQPIQTIAQPGKPAATPAKLSQKEESELRRAVIDYKKGKSRASAEQIINKYAAQYPNDPVVKAKISEKNKFDASAGIKSKK